MIAPLVRVLLTSTLLLWTAPLLAQTVPEYDQRAKDAYAKQDYREAIDLWQSAYDLSPDPVLTYNIAICHGKLGEYEQAIRTAELAEVQGLTGEVRAKNRARIRAYAMALTAGDVRPLVEPPTVVVAPLPEPKRSAVPLVVGLSTISVGAALGAGAFVVDRQLVGPVDEYDRLAAAGEFERANAQLDIIEPRQTTGRILTVSSIAVTTIGVAIVVYALTRKRNAERPVLSYFGQSK